MITTKFPKVSAIMVATFLFITSFAQYASFDGDKLRTALGESAGSAEVTGMINVYHCEMANPAHYLSVTDGIELMVKDGSLSEIRLYKNSSVYGSFKGALPKGMRFGMSLSDVKAMMGKPTVAYNSYLEFEQGGVVYACGFDGGKLTELTLSKTF